MPVLNQEEAGQPVLDLSQVTIGGIPGEPPATQPQDIPQPQQASQLDLSEVSITGAPKQEAWSEWLLRNVGATTKKLAKGALGSTGDVREVLPKGPPGLGDLVGAGAEKLASVFGLEEAGPALGKIAKGGFDVVTKGPASLAFQYAPSGKQIGKGFDTAAEALFGVKPDFFKGKTKAEKLLRSSAEDFGSILPFVLGGGIGLAAAGARSVVPNIAKMGAKAFGVGKTGQEATKLITQLGMGMFGNYDPKKAAKAAEATFERSIPPGRAADLKNTAAPMRKMRGYLRKGITTRTKKFLNKEMEDLFFLDEKDAGLSQMLATRNDLLETIKDSKTPEKALTYLKPLEKALTKDIQKGAASLGKDALKSLKFSDGVKKAMEQSVKPIQFIKDKVKGKFVTPISYATGALIGLATGGGATAAASALRGIAGVGLGSGLLKIADTVLTGPQMWKLYGNVFTQAAKENVGLTVKAINRLDRAIRKENPELVKK